jgi:hypothetical protein
LPNSRITFASEADALHREYDDLRACVLKIADQIPVARRDLVEIVRESHQGVRLRECAVHEASAQRSDSSPLQLLSQNADLPEAVSRRHAPTY